MVAEVSTTATRARMNDSESTRDTVESIVIRSDNVTEREFCEGVCERDTCSANT